jgi:hypothetical protein
VWYQGEEIFWKKGVAARTPWHQHLSQLPWAGDHWANCWTSLGSVPATHCLEVIRGSHRGTLYDGITFNVDDPTEPFWGADSGMPRVPDIEADRAADPKSWKDNLLLLPATTKARNHGGSLVGRNERLGELLKHYHLDAA